MVNATPEDPRQAKRRGRSRSPALLLKSGKKTIRGMLGGSKKFGSKSNLLDDSSTVGANATESGSAAAATTTAASATTEDFDDEVTQYDVEVDNASVATGVSATTSSPTKGESAAAPPKESTIAEEKEPELVPEAESGKPAATATQPAAAQAESPAKKTTATSDAASSSSDVAAKTTESTGSVVPLQIILLLMDAQSRRFELIQLAFDPQNASVKDVIGQIRLSATEEALRRQTYADVCSPDGELLPGNSLLRTHLDTVGTKQNILLALPTGMKTEDCTKLAFPILNDPKVKSMLAGIESPYKKKRATDSSTSSAVSRTLSDMTDDTNAKKSFSGSSFSFAASFKLSLVLLTVVAPALFFAHQHVSRPLAPGDALPAERRWRSSRGLLSVLPKDAYDACCVGADDRGNLFLDLSADGALTIVDRDDDDRIVWEMVGKCPGPDGGECEAVVSDNGSITIGGKKATLLEGAPGVASPWPFTVEPTKKTKKRKNAKKN